MQTLQFYKEFDGRWYVDLPHWKGQKSDLEMVAGADLMLNHIAKNDDRVWIILSENYFEGSDKLEFLKPDDVYGEGAFYILNIFENEPVAIEMWLCDVTKFVFGNFPNVIYISNNKPTSTKDFNLKLLNDWISPSAFYEKTTVAPASWWAKKLGDSFELFSYEFEKELYKDWFLKV